MSHDKSDDKMEDTTTEASATHEEINLVQTEEAQLIVQNYTLASLAPALFPVPLVDLVVLTGIQLKMLQALSKHYEQDFSATISRSAVTSLVSSILPIAFKPALASMLKFIPIIGQTAGISSMLILGAASTHALGMVFTRHFSSGGTLENFDANAVKGYFMEEFERGKIVAANLRQQANEGRESIGHPSEENAEVKH